MITKIQKWGNSLGLRIPKNIAQVAEVEEGTTVDLKLKDGRLILKPVKHRTYDLKDLLAKVTPQNIHGEMESGEPIGREVW